MARLPYPDYHTSHAKSHPIINITKLLSYSAATVDHWAGLGNAQFKNLLLSARDRELVIMLTTPKFNSTYEWIHHLAISLKAGVTKKQQAILEASAKQTNYFTEGQYDLDAGFSAKDLVLLAFVETIIQQPEVSDELWGRVKSNFSAVVYGPRCRATSCNAIAQYCPVLKPPIKAQTRDGSELPSPASGAHAKS